MCNVNAVRSVETIAYSTAWNNGGPVTVAEDGVAIENSLWSGDVVVHFNAQ